jgi:hypothetical protein
MSDQYKVVGSQEIKVGWFRKGCRGKAKLKNIDV